MKTGIKITVGFLTTLLSVIVALALFSIFLFFLGKNPLAATWDMMKMTFGSSFGFFETLVKMTPLLLCAMAVMLPARLGLVNVGGEGQIYTGALGATFVAMVLGPNIHPLIGIPLALLGAMVGGGLWALVPAILRSKGLLNETISTLLLNYVAIRLIDFFVFGILRDPASANVPQSPAFGEGFVLPAIPGTRVHLMLLIGMLILVVIAIILKKSVWGYEIRAIGGNPDASRRLGIRVPIYTVSLLILGGAIAGLAGAGEAMAIQGRLRPGFSADFGYMGFLISWLAGHRPLRVFGMSFLVAVLSLGGDTLQITQKLPGATVEIFMALILFIVLAGLFQTQKLESWLESLMGRIFPPRAQSGPSLEKTGGEG